MPQKKLAAFTIALAAMFLSGCAVGSASGAPSVAQTTEYQLGAGDGLRVIFYGEDKLNGEYRIGSNGQLALPLIGEVSASGKTLPELQGEIAAAYRAGGYLLAPKVAVEIISYRPFFVMGEVNAPGQYPFIPGMTVRQAIATAKGYTYRAQQSTVLITRWGNTTEAAYKLSPGTAVAPGDTIRIPERHF